MDLNAHTINIITWVGKTSTRDQSATFLAIQLQGTYSYRSGGEGGAYYVTPDPIYDYIYSYIYQVGGREKIRATAET